MDEDVSNLRRAASAGSKYNVAQAIQAISGPRQWSAQQAGCARQMLAQKNFGARESKPPLLRKTRVILQLTDRGDFI